MERLELEVFSQAVNAAVVRMPGRRFPGVVIQGDTLNMLALNARRGHMKEVAQQLTNLVSHYVAVLKAEGFELPFPELDQR